MIDSEDELNVEEEAELADWLEQVLVTDDSSIEAIALQFKTERNISLHDCQDTTRLQLDHFSAGEDTARDSTGA